MNVRFRTYARFAEIFGKELTLDLPKHARVMDALRALARSGIERDALFQKEGELKGYLVLVLNGKRLTRGAVTETKLQEGDELVLLPPVAGG